MNLELILLRLTLSLRLWKVLLWNTTELHNWIHILLTDIISKLTLILYCWFSRHQLLLTIVEYRHIYRLSWTNLNLTNRIYLLNCCLWHSEVALNIIYLLERISCASKILLLCLLRFKLGWLLELTSILSCMWLIVILVFKLR